LAFAAPLLFFTSGAAVSLLAGYAKEELNG
jgi:hypothetical protein